MRVLVVGSGGREHALAWKLGRSRQVSQLFCVPGNAGIAEIADCVPIGVDRIDELVRFAVRESIELTVIGPEVPLAAGLADRLQEVGCRVFGPGARAARIESDKAFARDLMAGAGVPTPRYAVFHTAADALAYLGRLEREGVTAAVVKASGLAAGKGAIVCDTLEAARAAVREVMVERQFGAAGDVVVIEERLVGEEASLLALCHGEAILPLIAAQDYKRARDGDLGLNTGGMGSYAPAPVITPARYEEAVARIFRPTLASLARAGTPYAGCLYGGVMITEGGLQTIEFNARFGDPETQAVLPLLETDLLELLLATIEGRPDQASIRWAPRKAVCVVMVAPGYPDSYPTGLPIEGLEDATADPDVSVFHAGTARRDGRLVTEGGRVLGVTGVGDTFAAAIATTYRALGRIHFEGAYYRRDIAARVASHV
jgi:phosphoribosylamine--glycine ligase